MRNLKVTQGSVGWVWGSFQVEGIPGGTRNKQGGTQQSLESSVEK